MLIAVCIAFPVPLSSDTEQCVFVCVRHSTKYIQYWLWQVNNISYVPIAGNRLTYKNDNRICTIFLAIIEQNEHIWGVNHKRLSRFSRETCTLPFKSLGYRQVFFNVFERHISYAHTVKTVTVFYCNIC